MKLLEFITYCTMKGIVMEHTKFGPGDPPMKLCDFYMVYIQARGYSVKIEYGRKGDWAYIVQAALYNHGRSKDINYKATLEEIVEAIMPNFDMASRIIRSETR